MNETAMADNVRVRFAPSPTGDPHVGNIRTALFNWLYARHTGGAFVLRIEDTDQARQTPGALDAILESLRWLGLDWDEGPEVGGPFGPYMQSERLAHYHEAADTLILTGHAYYCHCTSERLAEMRAEQQRQHQPPRYDGHCRPPSAEAIEASEDTPRVVRFMTPQEGDPIVVSDLIRGEVSFDPSLLDDFIILKSDGFPTYHLANVVDDHKMEITHVMRAEEWLSSTPRHLLLYDALGYSPPQFAHLPMILGPDRAKLSKRHGSTSLLDYKQQGYLPEAMCNFLMLLGWSLDDKTEVITRGSLVENFSLERVSKSPAIFNVEKLSWMNGVYIRQMLEEDLAARLAGLLEDYIGEHKVEVEVTPTQEYLRQIVPMVHERLKTLSSDEAWELCSFFLTDLPEYRVSPVPKGLDGPATVTALEEAMSALRSLPQFDAPSLEPVLRALAERLELRTRELFGAIRVAVTGREAAPPLFDTLAALGKERVLARMAHTVARIKAES